MIGMTNFRTPDIWDFVMAVKKGAFNVVEATKPIINGTRVNDVAFYFTRYVCENF
jgi:hypothetical protein